MNRKQIYNSCGLILSISFFLSFAATEIHKTLRSLTNDEGIWLAIISSVMLTTLIRALKGTLKMDRQEDLYGFMVFITMVATFIWLCLRLIVFGK